MQETNNKNRLGSNAIVTLIVIAIIVDLLSLIPSVGTIVGPLFWIGAGMYFWKAGLGFINGKRLTTGIISVIMEMILLLQWLPMNLIGIIVIIIITRIEDKTGISLSPLPVGKAGLPLVQGGMRSPKITSSPLNQGGIRAPGGGLTNS